MFKNPENAGMGRKISFQAKSYLFDLHEMFKNLGSDESTAARLYRRKHSCKIIQATTQLRDKVAIVTYFDRFFTSLAKSGRG